MANLVTLPNLYTTPNAIMGMLGSEGAQLRLDDENMATGQQIQVTIAAVQGATQVNVSPLQAPLLTGSQLVFDGAGLTDLVTVVMSSTGMVGDTTLNVQALSVALPALCFAQDNGVTAYLGGLLTRASSIATAKVKMYCCNRYDDSVLATSWTVYNWATIIGSRWVAKRRLQGCSEGLEDDYEEAIDEMKSVQVGNLQIEDIGTRTSSWPFMSNVTVDQKYDYNKIRVEPQLSEGTPTIYPQYIDWNSALLYQW
jgi:hypothetical protein